MSIHKLTQSNKNVSYSFWFLLNNLGLPGRPESRNAIFAPGKFNLYGASAFPGISDLLHEIDDLEGADKEARWKEIRRHVSDLMIMIQEAARFLRPVEKI